MFWLGKLIGAAIGFWLGGPVGAMIGALLGHFLYDRGQAQRRGESFYTSREQIENAFFKTTFSVMGHLAKADGRVSEAEIAAAESVMAQMSLRPEQRQDAIRWFTNGKDPGFPLDETLDEFRRLCRWRQPLIMMFLEIQLQVALADTRLDPAERRVLGYVFERMGFSRAVFEQLVGMMRGAQQYYRYSHAGAGHAAARPSLRDAYAVLGVSETTSDADVKKAYRRLMSRHHPDKLAAKGMPKEMINIAKEKVQEINTAYDQIVKARGHA